MPETVDNYVLNMHIFIYKSKLFIKSMLYLILSLFLISFALMYSYEIFKFIYFRIVKDIIKEYYELTNTNTGNILEYSDYNEFKMNKIAEEFQKSEGLI